MGILDNKISIIKNHIYGEDIRKAIWEAFDLLDDENILGKLDSVPTSSQIASMIDSAIAGIDIGSGILSFKGILANGAQLNRYALNIDRKYSGIYVLGPSRSYSNLPSDFPSNTNGILVNINTNDDEDVGLDAFVQIVYPIGSTFDGTYWVRTDIDEGWKTVGGGSGYSGLSTKGILPDNINFSTFGTVENEGIYITNTSFNYIGKPYNYDGSKVSIFKNYVFTNSNGNVAYRVQMISYVDGSKSWIRGKSGTSAFVLNDWYEVAGSGSGGTVNPQDIVNAVGDYLDAYGIEEEINSLIDSALNDLPDKTYSDNSELNTAVEKYKTITSGLSQDEITLINNAYNTYTGYTGNNATAKPAVADGVVGLAAFQYAKNALNTALNPIRSASDVQEAATAFIGSDNNKVDVGRDIPYYNAMSNTAKAAVADGIVGLAAFKRTEWFPTPQMYGAYGDGESDDRAAIQRAIDANKGGTLYFPAGTYMIGDTIQVGYAPIGNNAYTNLILDPCAIIKAKPGFHGATNTTGSAAGMIAIGQNQWHAWDSVNDGGLLINKSKKKFLIGGVFDSNSQRVSTIIRVSQDVYNFDMSYTEIIATDSTTGLAIGSSGWSRKNFGTSANPDWRYAAYDASKIAKGVEFVLSSMDAYIHHVNIRKHSYDVANRENFYTQAQYNSYVAKNYYNRVADDPGNDSNYNKHNRASGIVVYSNDNNFENIRVCYFKRNVKITHGTGNYFSEVHTLGLKAGYYVDSSGTTINPRDETSFPDLATWESSNPIFVEKPLVKSSNTNAVNKTIVDNYYSNYYPKDSSGFHLEKETEITLDKCYVDSDDFFLYVTPEAAGSKINVSQCMFFQYSEVEKNMVGFYLGNTYYTADTITMTPAYTSEWPSGTGVNQYNSSTEKVTINNPYKGKLTSLFVDGFQMSPSGSKYTNSKRHYGVKLSSNNFFDQTHASTMSFERIKAVGHNRFVYGDFISGFSSGIKGSVLLRPTTLERNGNTANSKWYALCSIPVGNGSNSAIQYRISLNTGGMVSTFSLYLYRYANPSNQIHLNASLGANNPVLVSDDDREYEIGFTYASNKQGESSAPCAYVMWIRMINGLSSNNAYYTRSIRGIQFESNNAITPAPYQNGFAELLSTSSMPSFVKINAATNNVIHLNCNTPSIAIGAAS